MSDLSEAMLAAGLHAWENCPFDDERDFRAFLAAALRVLADPGMTIKYSSVSDLCTRLANDIEHPEDGER